MGGASSETGREGTTFSNRPWQRVRRASAVPQSEALPLPGAGFAAAFLVEANVRDDHAAIDRLAHVVDGQRGGRDRGECLHLDTAAIERADGRGDRDGRALDGELEIDAGEPQRMAERD